jgi:hypothetical protein
MKTNYEMLNFLTGCVLVATGTIEMFQKRFESAGSWIIFGAMCLVMDDYIPKKEPQRGLIAISISLGRKIFSWIGLIGSMLVFGYVIFH